MMAELDWKFMEWLPDFNFLAVLTAILVGVAKTGVSGMAILVVPLIAMVFPAKESVGALLPMLIAGDVLAVIYYRRHAQWRQLVRRRKSLKRNSMRPMKVDIRDMTV